MREIRISAFFREHKKKDKFICNVRGFKLKDLRRLGIEDVVFKINEFETVQ